MSKRKIAIVLVNYNGFDDTKDCIKSLNEMQCEAETGLFVVDNASKENEAEKLHKIFPSVRIIASCDNLGFAGGNNLAIAEAVSSGYTDIMLLNNDTVVDSGLLDLLLKEYEEKTILVPKMLYYCARDTIWYGGGEINKRTGNSIHYKKNEKDNEAHGIVEECTFATGCCMLIPVSVIETIGMLDDTYFMYCEDTEYCLRALKNGIKIKYVSNAKLWHKVSQSTGGDESAFSIYYMTRNRLRYIIDYREFFAAGAYYFSVISRYIRAVQYAIKGKKEWKAFFKAISDSKKGIAGRVENYM